MTKYELNERKLKTFKAWFWAVGIGLFISIIGSVWWFSINTTSAINVNKANIETLSKEIDSKADESQVQMMNEKLDLIIEMIDK